MMRASRNPVPEGGHIAVTVPDSYDHAAPSIEASALVPGCRLRVLNLRWGVYLATPVAYKGPLYYIPASRAVAW